MENNFYTDDDFEQFLRTATDDFKMYPSRRIWHSLYNDLHPGRKWPSLAVCLVLVSAILFVGISNNNSINKTNLSSLPQKSAGSGNELASNNKKQSNVNSSVLTGTFSYQSAARIPESVSSNSASPFKSNYSEGSDVNSITGVNINEIAKTNLPVPSGNELITAPKGEGEMFMTDGIAVNIAARKNSGSKESITAIENNSENETVSISPSVITKNAANIPDHAKIIATNLKTTGFVEDRAWIENYAFQNRKSISKLRSFGNMQYYATTSVGFRTLKQKAGLNTQSSNSTQNLVASSNSNSQDINNEVTQKSAMNMEVGAALLYSVSKRLRVKAGVQFNYTNYVSIADKLNHPTETSLLVNTGSGFTDQPRISNYVNSINGQKNQKLNNTTLQLSLPIGADFRIAGHDKLRWYAASTIQPTVITGGNVFAISSDHKNYIEEATLLRKWNMNASFETFLSYKTSAGVIINLGPQVRYQLLSTYNSRYGYSEKLYNVGLKLGFTKSF